MAKSSCFSNTQTLQTHPTVDGVRSSVDYSIALSGISFESQKQWVRLHVQPSSPHESACNFMRL